MSPRAKRKNKDMEMNLLKQNIDIGSSREKAMREYRDFYKGRNYESTYFLELKKT